MKQILLILLTYFAFSLTSFSQPLMGIVSSSQNNVVVTTPNWNIFSEGFEGTGYENAGWTELLGANAGNLLNEDATNVTPPTGGGSQTLHLVKVITPTNTVAASQDVTYRANFASLHPIAYMDFYIQIHSYSLPATGNYVTLPSFRNSSNGQVFELWLANSLDNYKFNARIFNNGDYETHLYPTSGSITLDVWYHVQMKYDVTNRMYSCSINGDVVVANAALTGIISDGVQRVFIGDYTAAFAADFYIDNFNISSTNF